MAIYSVRYNLHCKAMNHHEACFTVFAAASAEQAREEILGTEPQECLGNECTEQLEEPHYPQVTVLSVTDVTKSFCLHGYLQRQKNGLYEMKLELDPDANEEIEFLQFPGYDAAASAVVELLPIRELSVSRPSSRYVETIARGVEQDLDGVIY